MDHNFYQRNLPHWQPQDCVFFITFRLEHSLPQDVLEELHRDREREVQRIRNRWQGICQNQQLYEMDKKCFAAYDAWLDQCLSESPRWLAQEQVAHIVMTELQRLNGQRYTLLAFCIMPNHVHLLIDVTGFSDITQTSQSRTARGYPLVGTLRLIKGRTARFCNQALERSGPFWHAESYDHVVRNDREFANIRFYILNNPVMAGLVTDGAEWPFTYVAETFERE